MTKKNLFFALVLATILIGLLILPKFLGQKGGGSPSLEIFAKCLTERGIAMYGADWCPHCQNEKKGFGEAFKFVSYVECPKDPRRCLEAKISGYPTWLFPSGKRLLGEQGIKKLSAESGCPLSGAGLEKRNVGK